MHAAGILYTEVATKSPCTPLVIHKVVASWPTVPVGCRLSDRHGSLRSFMTAAVALTIRYRRKWRGSPLYTSPLSDSPWLAGGCMDFHRRTSVVERIRASGMPRCGYTTSKTTRCGTHCNQTKTYRDPNCRANIVGSKLQTPLHDISTTITRALRTTDRYGSILRSHHCHHRRLPCAPACDIIYIGRAPSLAKE